jgi:integrase
VAVRQLPDGRWIYYHRDPITREVKREYCGRGPDGEAKARQRDREANHKPGRVARRHYGPTFEALSEVYVDKKGYNRKPRQSLSYRLDGAILPAIGHHSAMSLTISHLEDYVTSRRLDGVRDNSIAREITDIQAILNWATRRHPPLIPINPVRGFRPPPSRDIIILPPEPAEIAAIHAKACLHLKRFIALACYIGARPGAVELLSLTWSAVSWDGRTIRVISADKGGPPSRQVPLHDDLYGQMQAWYADDAANYEQAAATMPIIHYWGKPITTVKRAWKAALSAAGIKRRIRPYDLRHRFVTTALELGLDIGALADIVGSRPQTLRKHYQHVTADLHRKTIAGMPGLVPVSRTTKTTK